VSVQWRNAPTSRDDTGNRQTNGGGGGNAHLSLSPGAVVVQHLLLLLEPLERQVHLLGRPSSHLCLHLHPCCLITKAGCKMRVGEMKRKLFSEETLDYGYQEATVISVVGQANKL